MASSVVVIVLGIMAVGGLDTMWQRNLDGDRIEFFNMDPNPLLRNTFWTVTIGMTFIWLSHCGVNQGMMQRFLALPNITSARWSLFIFCVGICWCKSVSCLTGLLIHAQYHDCDPLAAKEISRSDQLLPYYVMDIASKIPGLPGLFVAGVFCAALSSMSTGLNTLCGVIYEDFLARILPEKSRNERTVNYIMKLTVCIVGVICVFLVFLVEKMGSVIHVTISLGGITYGAMLGLFSLGMFFPWANSKGALMGGLTSMVLTSWLVIGAQAAVSRGAIKFHWKPMTTEGCNITEEMTSSTNITEAMNPYTSYEDRDEEQPFVLYRLSYLYFNVLGCLTVIVVGLVVKMQRWWLLPCMVLVCSIRVHAKSYRIVCYFQSWAVDRPSKVGFKVNNIDASLCTHHVYSFAGLNSKGDVTIEDKDADIKEGGYRKFKEMKDKHHGIKIMFSIGGASAGSSAFKEIVKSESKRKTFADNVVKFVKKYGFDGADIDWEFPSSANKNNFMKLLKELRSKFDKSGYLLSVAVSADVSTIDAGYDVKLVSEYVHFINVMTYDMHGPWEKKTGENSPMRSGSSDTSDYERTQNVDYMIKYYIKKGASPSKINLGIGTYGNSFTLSSSSNNGVGAKISGPGKKAPYTGQKGKLGFFEICEQIKGGKLTEHWNSQQETAYATKGDQWVGYDNVRAVKIKAQYIKDKGLGGAMIWSIDQDDHNNLCGNGKYPLLNALKSNLK